MKYAIGFLLALSLTANAFFYFGLHTYAIKLEDMYGKPWQKPTMIEFKCFGSPNYKTRTHLSDSIYFMNADNFNYNVQDMSKYENMTIFLDSNSLISIARK